MGTRLDFTNYIDISEKTTANGCLKTYGYGDISDEFIKQITDDPKVKYIQISESLSPQAYAVIDEILEKRADMCFRIYGLYGETKFDLSRLHLLKHLKHLTLDAHLRNRQDMFDFDVLTELENLQTLRLGLFDLRDYGFIKNLSSDIKELCVRADIKNREIVFDCDWLARYKKLKTLYLGGMVETHIEHITEIERLENLTLSRVILNDFNFLSGKKLLSLSVHYCRINDLNSLKSFESLQALELWGIKRLKDISFISTLTGLEYLYLKDLYHITALPDLSALKNLQEVILDNVPVDVSALPIDLQKITCKYR